MTTNKVNEDLLEQAALQWFAEEGYTVINGANIAPGEAAAERELFNEVLLLGRLKSALARINPKLPADALDEAVKALLRMDAPSAVTNNHAFHKYLTEGITVAYSAKGEEKHEPVMLVDFDNIDNNDWLAVNQFAIIDKQYHRRPDIILFVNGLPLTVIELKNMVASPTLLDAFKQLQTYKNQIPDLFHYNELMVVSEGSETRIGTLTSDLERFMPWRSIDTEKPAAKTKAESRSVDSRCV
jgi:type I restriction enzyme R subunit